MQISELPEEDKTALRDALLGWKNDGTVNPQIPLNIDVDGDGVFDAYGLDDNDELVYVTGVKIEDTVAVSDGLDQEATE